MSDPEPRSSPRWARSRWRCPRPRNGRRPGSRPSSSRGKLFAQFRADHHGDGHHGGVRQDRRARRAGDADRGRSRTLFAPGLSRARGLDLGQPGAGEMRTGSMSPTGCGQLAACRAATFGRGWRHERVNRSRRRRLPRHRRSARSSAVIALIISALGLWNDLAGASRTARWCIAKQRQAIPLTLRAVAPTTTDARCSSSRSSGPCAATRASLLPARKSCSAGSDGELDARRHRATRSTDRPAKDRKPATAFDRRCGSTRAMSRRAPTRQLARPPTRCATGGRTAACSADARCAWSASVAG